MNRDNIKRRIASESDNQAHSRDEYIFTHWPYGTPRDCTRLDGIERDCLERNEPYDTQCESCKWWNALASEHENKQHTPTTADVTLPSQTPKVEGGAFQDSDSPKQQPVSNADNTTATRERVTRCSAGESDKFDSKQSERSGEGGELASPSQRGKFTPGPWRVDEHKPGRSNTPIWFVRSGPVGTFAVAQIVHGDTTREERKANAHLIAAAPELLEALKRLLQDHKIMEPHHEQLCDWCKQAESAISKAEGRSL